MYRNFGNKIAQQRAVEDCELVNLKLVGMDFRFKLPPACVGHEVSTICGLSLTSINKNESKTASMLPSTKWSRSVVSQAANMGSNPIGSTIFSSIF